MSNSSFYLLILISTPVLLQFRSSSSHPLPLPQWTDIIELDPGTVECGSWHGEPDPWAFQQHSLCTADIPGTRGSSYLPCTSAHTLFAFTSSFSINTPGGGNKLSEMSFLSSLPFYQHLPSFPSHPFILIVWNLFSFSFSACEWSQSAASSYTQHN